MPFFYKYVMPRCIHFELMPSSINMLHVFLYCLQCSLSHAYFGNARGEGDATREKRCRRNSSFSGLGCMSPNNNTTTPLLSTLGQQQQTARAVPLWPPPTNFGEHNRTTPYRSGTHMVELNKKNRWKLKRVTWHLVYSGCSTGIYQVNHYT